MHRYEYVGPVSPNRLGVRATRPAANGPTRSLRGNARSQSDSGSGPVVCFANT